MSTLGIDFGTTNSSASYVKPDGRVEAIRFVGHDLKMPSLISFYRNTPLFGHTVKSHLDNLYAFSPEQQKDFIRKTVRSIKRKLEINGRICGHSHKEVLTMFLRHVSNEAHKACPTQKFDRLVLTHPVHFEEWKKQMLKDAALQSGFSEVELLYEPVAAAIGYVKSEGISDIRGLLVYDFGGGTFDVAYVTQQDGRFIVPFPPKGDSKCGGDDIDNAIYNFITEKGASKIGFEYRQTRDLGLLNECQKWKELLTTIDSIPLRVTSKDTKSMFQYTLQRSDIEALAYSIVKKTVDLTKEVYDQIRENHLPLDYLLLIGGSSVMPMIAKNLKEAMPELEIRTTGNADIAVALGASYHGLNPVIVNPEDEWCYCMYDGKKILKSYNFCIYCGKPNFFKTGKF